MTTNYKVLIVEDDPMTLSLLSIMVKKIGDFEIVTCQSATEAIEKISNPFNKWQPDVVLSDFMMDNGDGIDLLKSVRKKFGKNLPFVFITCVHKDLLAPLIEAEIDINIVTKPLSLHNVKEMFSRFNLESQNRSLDEKMAA